MLRDRDGLSAQQIENLTANRRIRCLQRRHIENYFLDEEVLAMVAEQLYLSRNNNELTSESIKSEIERIAKESLGFNLYKTIKETISLNHFLRSPSISGVNMEDLEDVKSRLNTAIGENLGQLSAQLERDKVRDWIENEAAALKEQLENGSWLTTFHGKQIFSRVCADVLKDDRFKIRHAYVDLAMQNKPQALDEVRNLFVGM